MLTRECVCSQQSSCINCPLSANLTGKDCRELTQQEIQNIINLFRELEKLPETVIIVSLESYLRGEGVEELQEIYDKQADKKEGVKNG